MNKTKKLFAAGLLLLTVCTPARSADSSDNGWQWQLAPFYLWASSVSGDLAVGNPFGGPPIEVPIELEFSDIKDNLDAIFTANLEGMYDNRWGFSVDTIYLKLKGSQGPLTATFEDYLLEVIGLFRYLSGEHNVDFLFGLRYTDQQTRVQSPPGAPLPAPVGVDQNWTDPILGGRWWWKFAERWSLIVRGDFGGFGVGSDFTWQALALVDWQPFKYVSFAGGYRALYQDYEDGSGPDLYKYKATLHGPLVGFSIRW